MTRRLPLLILLSVICYLLFVIPSFAQEITPTIISSFQFNPQGQDAPKNAWESFQDLFIPKTLKQVNCSNLPLEICNGIKNVNSPKTDNETASEIKSQNNSTDNKQNVVEGAIQYNDRSGMYLPSNLSKASTDISSIFGGIIDFFSNIGKIFDSGNEAAIQSANKDLPKVTGVLRKESAMNDALPLSQCGELSINLCKDHKPNK